MKPPGHKNIIQIDVGMVCDRACGNCTRLVAHYRKPWLMDFATFRKAVDSLSGYTGMVSMFGGEPTLHPDFERMAEYLHAARNVPRGIGRSLQCRQPIADFGNVAMEFLRTFGAHYYVRPQRGDLLPIGLFSNCGPGYYRHYETIHEIFRYQAVNDHWCPVIHQAFLCGRAEVGIADAEWTSIRDNCWLQSNWSSSVTPKGAFFCEVAGALDALYGGPGGWPIEPGWWKRTPADFGDQLRWCEMCAIPLMMPRRPSDSGIWDVSPMHLERLRSIASPAIEKGAFRVLDMSVKYAEQKPDSCGRLREGDSCICDWYMPNEWKGRRYHSDNPALRPKRIDAITVCVGHANSLKAVIEHNRKELDSWTIATMPQDKDTQELAREHGCDVLVADSRPDDKFDKAEMLQWAWDCSPKTDWTLLLDADVRLPERFSSRIRSLVLNPGCLYYTRRFELTGPNPLVNELSTEQLSSGSVADIGCFQLFHPNAKSSAGCIDYNRWPEDKRILLHPSFSVTRVRHESNVPASRPAGSASRGSCGGGNIARRKSRVPLQAVTVCVEYDDYLSIAAVNRSFFDKWVIVTSKNDIKTQELCEEKGLLCHVTDKMYENGATFNKGKALNEGLRLLDSPWVLSIDSDIVLPTDFNAVIQNQSLCNDFIYGATRFTAKDVRSPFSLVSKDIGGTDNWERDYLCGTVVGFFQLFRYGHWFPEEFGKADRYDMIFRTGFKREVMIEDLNVIHLPHGERAVNWNGRKSERIMV